METVASSKLYSILSLYDLQTGLFKNSLAGIDEKDTHNRLNSQANHIAWLAGSLVEQRFEMARELGVEKRQQADDLFRNNQGIKADARYPSLDVYKKDWEEITPVLRDALSKVTDEELKRTIDMGPEMKFPLYDLITFTSYREASLIGQIALYRRLLGYPAMSYM